MLESAACFLVYAFRGVLSHDYVGAAALLRSGLARCGSI